MDILKKLRQNHYESKLPYPNGNNPEDVLARLVYEKDEVRLEEEFRREAIDALGLTAHPRAHKAFTAAWDRYYQHSHEAVFKELQYLADILLG